MEKFEEQTNRRMKAIIPTDLEITDYDEEMMSKNLELQLVEVTITKEPYIDQSRPQLYKRTVERSDN